MSLSSRSHPSHDDYRADDDEVTLLQDITNIGEIRVTIHRIHRVKLTKREIQQREKNLKRNGNRRDVNTYKEFPGTGPVHESSKKAGAHCITYVQSGSVSKTIVHSYILVQLGRGSASEGVEKHQTSYTDQDQSHKPRRRATRGLCLSLQATR